MNRNRNWKRDRKRNRFLIHNCSFHEHAERIAVHDSLFQGISTALLRILPHVSVPGVKCWPNVSFSPRSQKCPNVSVPDLSSVSNVQSPISEVSPMFQSHATSPLLSSEASSTSVTADLLSSDHNHFSSSPSPVKPQFTRLESRPPPSALIQVIFFLRC